MMRAPAVGTSELLVVDAATCSRHRAWDENGELSWIPHDVDVLTI
jgi:hypothetical protein